jgi:hypothetical protein
MFHVEIRSGSNYIHEFNVDERRLWVRFLAPLMEDESFKLEGHEYHPRVTTLIILDGPELRPDQLGSMGRGWQNAQRYSKDVTDAVLARAHELREGMLQALEERNVEKIAAAVSARAADLDAGSAVPALAAPAATALRERLIGRLGAGPVSAAQMLAVAESLLPSSDEAARELACAQAVWEILASGEAQLAASDR